MMIKVFTTNKNGKIELTKDELKALLDEAYWDGYKANSTTYVYRTPAWQPYIWNYTTSGTSNTFTLSNNATESITVSGVDYENTVGDPNFGVGAGA